MDPEKNFGQRLEGKWLGQGSVVDKPKAPPLRITLEVEYVPAMKPFYFLRQYAYNASNDKLLTAENGTLRVLPGGHYELLFGDPQGVAEILEGDAAATDAKLRLTSTHITRTSTAKEPYVLSIVRSFAFLEDGSLEVTFDQATTLDTKVHDHLRHVLKKI